MSTILRSNPYLADVVDEMWCSAIASKTKQVYSSGLVQFLRFASMHNVPCSITNLPSVSENLLLLFVAYCSKHLNLSGSTIKLYLAGIRFAYVEAGVPNPAGGPLERLNLLLKAVTRNQGQQQRIRLPITSDILAMLCTVLREGAFTPFTDVLLHAVIVVAFFGFLRCGEFTTNTVQFNPEVNLCMEDVSFDSSEHVFLRLKSSKTDQFRKGVIVTLCTNDNFCPVGALNEYIAVRRHRNPNVQPCDPLFVSEDGRPLTRSCFLHYLRQLLSRVGLDSSKYSGHSFRIGAASSAAQRGIQDHMIKTLGRWSSNSYNRYIHVTDNSLHNAQSALAYSL